MFILKNHTIGSRTLLAMTANNIHNLGGRISANELTLDAKQDLNNIGGVIAAQDSLNIKAGRDINVISTTQSAQNLIGASSFTRRCKRCYFCAPHKLSVKANMKTKNFLPSAHKLSYNNKKTLEDLAHNVRYKRNNGLATTLEFMADEHIKIGRDAYFGGGDMQALKQHFHVSAKLQHLATTYDGTRQLWTNQLYNMLSDNSEVIHDWAALATEPFIKLCNKPTEFHFYTHMYQLAIRKDYAELQAKLNMAKNSPDKKILKNFGSKIELFSLFLERDKKGLEAQILALAKKWQSRINHNGMTRTVITAQAMATDAMEYAKLCWLKGIEVEIDHPLIPMELLPIKPLENYNDLYDFLSPDWIPPPQNFIEKITKLFSK